jgi:hypothetical protein
MIAVGRLSFEPLLAPWALAALAALSLITLGIYVWRGGSAPWLRGAGVALVLAALAQPVWVRETRLPAPDVAVVLIDQSESMAIAGRDGAARQAAERLAERLSQEPDLEVRVREVGGGGDGTLLAAAIESAVGDIARDRLAGVVALTEGQLADAPEDPDALRSLGPIHALIVGDPGRGDRRLTLLNAPAFGVVGEDFVVEARVDDPIAGAAVELTASINGEVVRTLTVQTGQPFTVRLRATQRGASMVMLEAAAGAAEITLSNNRAAFALSGVRDRLRVLLITGEPHAGARVWRNMLKADPSVDLIHFTILRPLDKPDFTTSQDESSLIQFPTEQLFARELDNFDLIIFDRWRERGILEQRYFFNIARRIQAGGALLVATGPGDAANQGLFITPLGALLPAQPTGQELTDPFRPSPTALGARHPIVRGLPSPAAWGRWTRQIGARATGGQTLLAGAAGSPLLTIDTAGAGRVAAFWSDQPWLWARGYEGGGPHGELLRRLIHWLMGEPELDAERLTLTAEGDSLTIERSSLSEDPGAVTLIAPDGAESVTQLTPDGPGAWTASIPTAALGLYEARAGALRAFAAIGPLNPREAAALQATGDLIQPLAEASGGGVTLTGEDGQALPDVRRVSPGARAHGAGWIGLRRNEAYTVRTAAASPLGPAWAWAFAGVGLFMLGWRRETR